MTPTGNAGLEYEKLQVLRILDDAAKAEAKLDRQRVESGKDALPRIFYLADDMEATRAGYERLTSKRKRKYYWTRAEHEQLRPGRNLAEAERSLEAEKDQSRRSVAAKKERRGPAISLQIIALALTNERVGSDPDRLFSFFARHVSRAACVRARQDSNL
jgi:hypothetical protein